MARVNWQLHMGVQRADDWWYSHDFTGSATATTTYGAQLIAPKSAANRNMLANRFEEDEMRVVRSCIEACDVFVDIGANIGFYTCIAGMMGKRVVAFEPQPRNLRYLYRNILNNHIAGAECYPLALGTSPDLLTLYGASGTGASLLSGWAGYSDKTQQVVPVNALDNVLGDRFTNKKLLIKIDVEGAEYGVLQGASKTLAVSPRPTWFVEIALNEFHPGGMNPHYQDTFQLFWDAGYLAKTADGSDIVVTPALVTAWSQLDPKNRPPTFNYLFTSQ